jgi:hypothetical protein
MCAQPSDEDGSAATTPPLIDATAPGDLPIVPASWIFAQARQHAIPHVRLGRYVRFSQEESLDWACSSQRRGAER